MDDIFKSDLELKFKSEEIEKEYQANRYISTRLANKLYSVLVIMISMAYNLVYSLYSVDGEEGLLKYIFQISINLLGIQALILFLSLSVKKLRIEGLIPYLNVYFFMISNAVFRIFLLAYDKTDYMVFTIIYLLQQFVTLTSFYSGCLDFNEGFLVYLCGACSSVCIYSKLIEQECLFKFAIDLIVTMSMNFISYFYVLEKRKSFYYSFMTVRTNKLYKCIFDTMNIKIYYN